MLVGDHGRVIPFRHFKTLIVGVGVVLTLSLCALILLGVLYTRQRGQIGRLQEDLEQLQAQSAKFRDEKDLYLTQLIALQKQSGALPQKPADVPQTRAEEVPPSETKATPEKEEPAPEAKKVQAEKPVPKAEPQVQWSADIRNFNVSYDNRQGVLTSEFRIYNTTRPKQRLKGRTVVIFKTIGDPPNQWAIVPTVPLQQEIPVGEQGRSFNIQNYQTERFKTLRRTNSPKYDIAAVYVFTDPGGELIGKKELPFNVDYSPPAPPKPVAAPPKPVVAPPKAEPEKSSAPSQVPQVESAPPKQSPPGDSTAPDSAPKEGESQITTKPIESSPIPSDPDTPSGEEQPKSKIETDGNGTSTEEASEAVPPTPAAEPKPAKEGELQ